jgi:glycosyltransferase involved in cell wall biosynthesis
MRREMRILVLSHALRDPSGGAASTTLELSEAVRLLGHEVQELYLDDLLLREFPPKLARELVSLAAAWCAVRAGEDVDVIEITGHAAWLAFPLLRLKRRMRGRRKPLLVARSYGLEHFDHRTRLEQYRRGQLKLSPRYFLGGGFLTLREVEVGIVAADLFAASRPPAIDYVVQRHMKRRQSCVATGFGLVDAFFEPPFPPSPEPGRIAWLGTCVERKGWQYFVEAVNQLEADERFTFSLLGTGRPQDAVLDEFEPAVARRIDVYPRLSRELLIDELRRCEAFVSASLSEGYHLAALQAMALGLVVISTKEGFMADLESDVEPIFIEIPKRSPQAIVAAVTVLAGDHSASLYELQDRARRFAQGHRWSRMAEETIEAYERACKLTT